MWGERERLRLTRTRARVLGRAPEPAFQKKGSLLSSSRHAIWALCFCVVHCFMEVAAWWGAFSTTRLLRRGVHEAGLIFLTFYGCSSHTSCTFC